jgi:hypothetical protein
MASEGGEIPFGWKGPVLNFRSSVGPWRSWERASMASRRSWVRIPSAPPKRKQTNTLSIYFRTNWHICSNWTLPNLLHAFSVSLGDQMRIDSQRGTHVRVAHLPVREQRCP